MKCLCRWNAKNKKKLNFCRFVEGNDEGPRQRRVLCRGPSHCPRQRFFLKKFCNISLPRAMVGGPRQRLFFKKIKFLCRGPAWKPSAKIFQKKRIILCRGPSHCPRQRFFGKILHISLPRARPSAKIFQKKKNNSLPRAVPLPSAKIFWKNSAHFFAEGPRRRPSAKTPSQAPTP